ncbi:MAG: hypothetical protein Tsb0019_09030 [Roseibium sp.]
MMRKTILATVAAVMVSAGVGSASAMTATYDYTGGNNPAGGPSLSCGVSGILNANCSVTFNAAGLGIDGNPDLQPGQIDGQPIASSEALTFDFGFDRVLDSISFGDWDFFDDLTLSWDGGSTSFGPGAASTAVFASLIPGGVVSSFLTVTATGVFPEGFIFGDDQFTVASLTVSSVPVPAALPLLAGGLGLLGFAGRRRKNAA